MRQHRPPGEIHIHLHIILAMAAVAFLYAGFRFIGIVFYMMMWQGRGNKKALQVAEGL
jgi:hypothetical protein